MCALHAIYFRYIIIHVSIHLNSCNEGFFGKLKTWLKCFRKKGERFLLKWKKKEENTKAKPNETRKDLGKYVGP